MNTEVETQQPTVAPVVDVVPVAPIAPVAEVNGTTTETVVVSVPNGETKAEKKNGTCAKKEQEPPKDPQTDTSGWLAQQHKAVIQKANFLILKWALNEVYAEDDQAKPTLPKSGFVSKREFVNYLKDGVILARFANKFQPGAAEAVKEGEEAKQKENQQANINIFTSVAKQHVPEEQIITHEDLEKGKESYAKAFANLFQVMLKATSEHFKVPGGNFEEFKKEIEAVSTQNFWQKFIGSLKSSGSQLTELVRRPFTRSNSTHNETEQTEATTNGVHANGTETTTTAHEENGVPNGTKVEEKKDEVPVIPAVVAN